MLRGKSYYHQVQGLGKAFEAGRLKGYFNDMTGKTEWTGRTDQDGIPNHLLSNGNLIYFPIFITQKALGHWDRWLLDNSEADREQFLLLTQWLVGRQDDRGGWDTWSPFETNVCSKYSAMTQGQALSVLSRASLLTGRTVYHSHAEKALELMLTSVDDGGVTSFEHGHAFLEEAPKKPVCTILNGWIFSLFGLYDFNLCFSDKAASGLFDRTLNSLVEHLADYDSGYWSYYNSCRNLASPFYHELHLSQLSAMSMIADDPVFDECYARWRTYQGRLLNRKRAFLHKAVQKLREPPRVTIVG